VQVPATQTVTGVRLSNIDRVWVSDWPRSQFTNTEDAIAAVETRTSVINVKIRVIRHPLI